MITYRQIREKFHGRLQEGLNLRDDIDGYKAGARAFLRDWHQQLGVGWNERDGAHVLYGANGIPYKAPGSAHASDVSIRNLAEAIFGHEQVEELYHPRSGFEGMGSARALQEAAIDPSTFVNINLFNASVAGLINAEIMDRYESMEYMGRNLVEIKATNMNGHKRIRPARISPLDDASKGRAPGEAHVENGFSEMYQNTPVTVERAEKIVVTREAVYFDYSGLVIEQAGEIGDDLAYGQDKNIADTVIGVTGLPSKYNFNGTSYEAYQTSSPWINDSSNAFNDVTNIDTARVLFQAMTDPATTRELKINSYDILCTTYKELSMRNAMFGPQVQIGTQLNSNFPSWWTAADAAKNLNAVAGGSYRLMPLTNIWYNRLTAANGLNLADANARKYWWIGDYKKAVVWHENWPLTPWQASADELTMKDRGLVAVYGANFRGQSFWKEPRHVVRNKN